MPYSRISRFGFVNTYLVEDEDGLTVIDTMIPGSAKGIVAAAAKHGMPIARILLTHAHQDHIGSLDALHEAAPEAEVIIGAREERLLDQDKSLDPGEPQSKLRGGYPGAEVKPTRTLAAGDRVGSLETHASPGHTPGPPVVPRHPRRDAVLRRRVLDPRRRADVCERELALPAADDGDLGQADGAREREGAAGAESEAARPRARQGDRGPRRGDGRRDRPRRLDD